MVVAKPKIVKCQHCEQKDTTSDLMIKGKKGYYHPDCYKKFEKHQAFIDKELQERDLLWETIKEIHNLIDIPDGFMSQWVQKYRNGMIIGKDAIKKYKKGVPYIVMRDAYLICRREIEATKKNIEFESDIQELIYCFKIIQGRVNDAYRKQQKKKMQAEKEKQIENQVQESIVEEPQQFNNNREDELDISEFL